MTNERFTEAAVSAFRQELVDLIREISVARKIFPVNTAISADQNTYIYYTINEKSEIQYNYELTTPQYNRYATTKTTVAIPIHQADLALSRHEKGRAEKDILTLDRRTRELVADMVADEERTAIYGAANVGSTSLADTTNNATAAATELDLTTFATATNTFHLMISQLSALLKNKFQGAKLHMVWTSDVDARARACFSTTEETLSFYEYAARYLGKYNGGAEFDYIHSSNYLGSEAGTGTTNCALVASDPRNMELISSELEVVVGETPLKDHEIQIALRSRPIFYRTVNSVIYGGTVDVTA
jgi:hypothetical protein